MERSKVIRRIGLILIIVSAFGLMSSGATAQENVPIAEVEDLDIDDGFEYEGFTYHDGYIYGAAYEDDDDLVIRQIDIENETSESFVDLTDVIIEDVNAMDSSEDGFIGMHYERGNTDDTSTDGAVVLIDNSGDIVFDRRDGSTGMNLESEDQFYTINQNGEYYVAFYGATEDTRYIAEDNNLGVGPSSYVSDVEIIGESSVGFTGIDDDNNIVRYEIEDLENDPEAIENGTFDSPNDIDYEYAARDDTYAETFGFDLFIGEYPDSETAYSTDGSGFVSTYSSSGEYVLVGGIGDSSRYVFSTSQESFIYGVDGIFSGEFTSSGDIISRSDGQFEISQLPTAPESLEISIDDETGQYNSTGSSEFDISATIEFDDGTSQDVTSETDFNLISGNSVEQVNNETWRGIESGASTIEGEWTDEEFGSFTDQIDVTIEDPEPIDNIFIHDAPTEINKSEENQLLVIAEFEDSTETDITNEVEYESSNNTRLTVSDSGLITGQEWGEVTVKATYEDVWYSENYTAETEISVLGDPESLDLQINPSGVEVNQSADISANLVFEDGREEDVFDEIDQLDWTFPVGASTDLDNRTITPTELGNHTLSASITRNGETYSDDATVEGLPRLEFEDYEELSAPQQLLVIIWNAEFLALLIALGASVGVTKSTRNMAMGMSTFGILLILGWVIGFISTFLVVAFTIFAVFVGYVYSDLNVHNISVRN